MHGSLPRLVQERQSSPGVTACYCGAVELSRTQWGSVSSFAVRVAHFAGCVAEAHGLGHGPGGLRKPWGIEFQRRACSVYAETVPAGYLRGIADASGYCADLMGVTAPKDSVSVDWETVSAFLRVTSEALLGVPEVAALSPGEGAAEIGSSPPAVLRYERFAEMLHPSGVAKLGEAAKAVAHHCASRLGVAPSAQELGWIISVAVQEPIEELAQRNQTSTRGMYRRIEKMWERFGVANQVQGVALAVQRGWIAPPPWGDGKDRAGSSRK